MDSKTHPVQHIFEERRRYCVPFYQRTYVWNAEEQWAPLWSDIESKADQRLENEEPTAHFLGAIVLEPRQLRGLRGVPPYNIIDGQQRLTTLQFVLAALSMCCVEHDAQAIGGLVRGYRWNGNEETMDDVSVEKFKLWPTYQDRPGFSSAMQAETFDDLRSRFPQNFTLAGSFKKVGVVHPPALAAIVFFHEQICRWIDRHKTAGVQRADALERLLEAVVRDLRLVVITLSAEDDAQIIFETLNGRGAELHATDLIRNFIFMRADADKANAADLYDEYWIPFEDRYWREPLRRGRLNRPRLEWFVQSMLMAETADEIEIGRLYTAYRRFCDGPPARPAVQQLLMMRGAAETYVALLDGAEGSVASEFGRRISAWDASSLHPLVLAIMGAEDLVDADRRQMFVDLESYLVRRAVCRLTAKSYNKTFLSVLRRLKHGAVSPQALRQELLSYAGDVSRWPSDAEFERAWLENPVYDTSYLGPARTKAVLAELESGMRSAHAEESIFRPTPQHWVEHILPTAWYEHWPLPNGRKVTRDEATSASMASLGIGQELPDHDAIMRRESIKNTFGNLTLLSDGLNRELSNLDFETKREGMFSHSVLHLNRVLMVEDYWDEEKIKERGRAMFAVAKSLWPCP